MVFCNNDISCNFLKNFYYMCLKCLSLIVVILIDEFLMEVIKVIFIFYLFLYNIIYL